MSDNPKENTYGTARFGFDERVLLGITLILCAALIAFNVLSLSGYLPNGTGTSAVSLAPYEQNADDGKININTATAGQLATLPGIGEKRAANIIEYRGLHGMFQNIDDLVLVPDIGEVILSRCREHIKAELPAVFE